MGEEAERDKRRVQEKERQIKLTQMAQEFHKHLTVKQYGFRPWLKLMISKKVESSLADNHHTTKIKRTVFSAWLEQARITRKEKENKADRFFLQKWFRLWAKVSHR